ncbi:hypothetical protein BU24DRAFT_436763 [Aaosphaeria arxii CBS 175.79]|uniref:Nitrogen regulatory protein areA GATA-like domain-containing protein n=1 Tax=Aaosphaeria arxii CBS 175.79 TaxID=1450172 RepID=A0A6A5XA26_9PLEO|nr:uncharacterized protein BU24DRAFT_436763 [Aaosphaeria arxii CBS 175.79]KAF2009828.1 hypothetical protein BU24DRAFT_436763 [Aaosphaeria arxii CBS 175.79]
MLRTSASHTSFFDATAPYGAPRRNYSHSDLRSGSLSSSQTSSYHSTPASSLSLDTGLEESSSEDDDDDDDDDEDGGLSFPAYNTARYKPKPRETRDAQPSSPTQTARPAPTPADISDTSPAAPTDPPLPISEDDSAVRIEPTHHVDYLSHEWNEEDIWSSWRHIVEHRKVYGERSRLENASWRTWAKSQFKLRTVSPETLNWLKDCDVTWLYGPLQPAAHRTLSTQTSEPVSRLSKSNSFLQHKKPILKKRSMSEVMLQNSLSSSSLVKQAAAAVQAQQLDTSTALARRRQRPVVGRATSDYITSSISSIPSRTTSRDPTDYFSSRSTSGLQTPDHGERKHIRFDEKVEQCIAVECKDGMDDDDDDDANNWRNNDDDDSSSDDGVVMMKRSRKRAPLSRSASRLSVTGDTKIIAKLPSTTLKCRTDSPDITEQQPSHSLGLWRSSRLSPSPSQETLRPSNPSTNFLLPNDDGDEEEEEEDDDEDDGLWEPDRAYEVKRPGTPTPRNPNVEAAESENDEPSQSGGLRKTASGMFMPFDEMDDDPTPPGLIGRVVDTVNTARDIAHVIWNVGWRG